MSRDIIPKQKELSFILIVVGSVIIASLITGLVILGVLNKPLSTDFHKILITINNVKEKIKYTLLISIFFQTLLSLFFLVIFALRYSHKISGPMYRLKMLVSKFVEGEGIEKVFFRQNDFLKPFEGRLTRLFSKESERRRLVKMLEECLKKSQKGANSLSDCEQIKDIVSRLKELD